MRRLLVPAILVVLLSGCGRALSPEEAQALLRQVQLARRGLTVDARLTTSVRVRDTLLHSDGRMQRTPGLIHVQYLTGRFQGWQVIEQDGLVWRIDPQGKPHASAAGAEAGIGLRGKALQDLTVRYEGVGWAAGRRVARYSVQPTRSEGARIDLWIDHATYFPLRLVRRDSAGQVLSATVYRRIDYQAQPPKRLPVPSVASPAGNAKRARQATEEQLVDLLGGPLLRPAYVPAGFKSHGTFLHPGLRRLAAEIRYSDGMRTFAVIQAKAPSRPPGRLGGLPPSPEQARRRALWARLMGTRGQDAMGDRPQPREEGRTGLWRSVLRGSVLRERRGDRMVMVVGELPPDELQKVLKSIPYPPGQKPAVHF